MALMLRLARPAYCRLWRRLWTGIALVGVASAITPVALWATGGCDGYYWGSVCANGDSTCYQCEGCVTTECSRVCALADLGNCYSQGDYTCSRHFSGNGC